MTNTELIEQFLDACWMEQGLSPNTLSAYGSDLKIFAKWLNNKPLLETDYATLLSFWATGANRYQQPFQCPHFIEFAKILWPSAEGKPHKPGSNSTAGITPTWQALTQHLI